MYVYIYICIYIYKYVYVCMYIYLYRKSASRFSRGTVLNTLKQSRINIMRGKKDVTTFPDKPVGLINYFSRMQIFVTYKYILYSLSFHCSFIVL